MTMLILLGTLRARTAIHPGSGDRDGVVDKLVHRDGRGSILIPGTGMAGAMRSLATRLAPGLGMTACVALTGCTDEPTACDCPVCRLFGEIRPDVAAEGPGRASRLVFAHAVAELPDNAGLPVRDGVGIERQTGTSACGSAAKYDYEVVPSGTTFTMRIEWETSRDRVMDAVHGALLGACLAEWRAGRLLLGGGAGRGLGAMDLVHLSTHQRDLTDPDQLLKFLQSDTPWDLDPVIPSGDQDLLELARVRRKQPSDGGPGRLDGFAELRMRLTFDGPVLFNDPAIAVLTGYDHAPLVELDTAGNRLVLPGSALRGVLRAQAERIARTIVTEQVTDPDAFKRHCPACDPNVRDTEQPLTACDAFATTGDSSGQQQDIPTDQLCLGCQLFGSTLYGSRLRVEGGNFTLPTKQATRIRDFVAIDRFTGGVKGNAKFDALVPAGHPAFDTRLFLENPEPWELGWLFLALRDMAEGLVPLGFGGAKGFGRVKLDRIELIHGRLGAWENGLGLPRKDYQDGMGLFEERRFAWDQDKDRARIDGPLRHWIDAFRSRCLAGSETRFERDERFWLKADSYFGRKTEDSAVSLETLYSTKEAAP